MAYETAVEGVKTRVRDTITQHYNQYFREWISDPWHSGLPTMYVDIVCSHAGSIRDRFPGLLGDLSVKKLESMAENLFYAIESFVHVFPNHTLEMVLQFAGKMIEIQFEDNEIHMLFEEDGDDSE